MRTRSALRQTRVRALVHQIDDALGALLPRFPLDRTVVAFTSDHGDYAGHRGLAGKAPWIPFDDLIRVPLLLAGPGIAEGRRVDALVQSSDLPLTFCEIADVPLPMDESEFDSCSLVPHLAAVGPPVADDRTVRFLYNAGWPGARRGTTKLICHWPSWSKMLFDLERDPGETVDHSEDPEYADVLADLEQIVWAGITGDPAPDRFTEWATPGGPGARRRQPDRRGQTPRRWPVAAWWTASRSIGAAAAGVKASHARRHAAVAMVEASRTSSASNASASAMSACGAVAHDDRGAAGGPEQRRAGGDDGRDARGHRVDELHGELTVAPDARARHDRDRVTRTEQLPARLEARVPDPVLPGERVRRCRRRDRQPHVPSAGQLGGGGAQLGDALVLAQRADEADPEDVVARRPALGRGRGHAHVGNEVAAVELLQQRVRRDHVHRPHRAPRPSEAVRRAPVPARCAWPGRASSRRPRDRGARDRRCRRPPARRPRSGVRGARAPGRGLHTSTVVSGPRSAREAALELREVGRGAHARQELLVVAQWLPHRTVVHGQVREVEARFARSARVRRPARCGSSSWCCLGRRHAVAWSSAGRDTVGTERAPTRHGGHGERARPAPSGAGASGVFARRAARGGGPRRCGRAGARGAMRSRRCPRASVGRGRGGPDGDRGAGHSRRARPRRRHGCCRHDRPSARRAVRMTTPHRRPRRLELGTEPQGQLLVLRGALFGIEAADLEEERAVDEVRAARLDQGDERSDRRADRMREALPADHVAALEPLARTRS